MLVSVRDEMLMTGGYASIAEGLKDVGLSAIEMAVSRDSSVRAIIPTADKPRMFLNSDEDVDALAEQLASTKTRVTSLLIPNNFGAKELDTEVAWVIRNVQMAGKLGANAVRIDSAMEGGRQLPVKTRQEIFSRCVKKIISETSGVDLGIENHGVEGNDPEFLLGLIHMVGSKRLGITMDMGNFYWAGYPIDELYTILQRLAPYAKHTHVKNIAYPAEMRNTRRQAGYEYGKYVCPIAEGDIDLKRVIGFLKAAGYRRDLCIEDESLGRFDEQTRRKHLREAAAFLASTL
jgi:sugar phosphate isomerase/epimerase